MARALYVVYVLALGAAAAIGAFGSILFYRLLKRAGISQERKRMTRSLIAISLGTAGKMAILLLAIIPGGTIPPSGFAFLYLIFMAASGIGLLGLTRDAIDEVSKHDAVEHTLERIEESKAAQAEDDEQRTHE